MNLGRRLAVPSLLVSLGLAACGSDPIDAPVDLPAAAREARSLPAPWRSRLAQLDTNPGRLASRVEAFLDGSAGEPPPVRLLVSFDGTALTVVDGPYPVRHGSLKFQRMLQKRRTDPPDAWLFFWEDAGGDPAGREPTDWSPLDTGPKIRGYHDHDSAAGHGLGTITANEPFPVTVPFYPGGRFEAITSKGASLGAWTFGPTPQDDVQANGQGDPP